MLVQVSHGEIRIKRIRVKINKINGLGKHRAPITHLESRLLLPNTVHPLTELIDRKWLQVLILSLGIGNLRVTDADLQGFEDGSEHGRGVLRGDDEAGYCSCGSM